MNPNQNPNQKKSRRILTPPRAVREFTAGGVVYRRKNGDIDILMIQDLRDRWTIPKGHVEAGESLEQIGRASCRERV